jgi:hypothetical protein
MSLTDYQRLFANADITRRSDQEKYSRYIDAAVAQGHIKADEIIGVGEGQFKHLYVVSNSQVTSACESGLFKKRIEIKGEGLIGSIAKLEKTKYQPTAEAIKFEGRSAQLKLVGFDSDDRVKLDIAWDGSDNSVDMRQREHLFNLIGKAMEQAVLRHVGLRPLTARGQQLVEEMKDDYSSAYRGVGPDGAWLFGPHYAYAALEVYQRRLAVMEPQFSLHIEARLYD